jgi:hypothetical protein
VHGDRRREPQWNAQGHGVPGIFACGANPAGPEGACDRRDNATADGTLRDGNHQRNQWKHRRDTGKTVHARSRYEIDLDQSDKDLNGHDGGIGNRKPQDHGRDWLLQQHPGAGVQLSGALDGRRVNFFGKLRAGARLSAALFGSRKCVALT